DRGVATGGARRVFAGAPGETSEERCDENGTRDEARSGRRSAILHARTLRASRGYGVVPSVARGNAVRCANSFCSVDDEDELTDRASSGEEGCEKRRASPTIRRRKRSNDGELRS